MRPQEPRRQRRFKRIEDAFLLIGDAEFFPTPQPVPLSA
jgi:hypothetical protein